MPTLNVVSWNVNGLALRKQPELLAALPWDVCAIQEATTPAALEQLATRACASSWCSAREHLRGRHADRQPRYVSAVLVREPLRIASSGVIEGAPSPERALAARVTGAAFSLTIASLALPPASSRAWGVAGKANQCRAIVDFLGHTDGPVVAGLDANTPRRDAIALDETEFWNAGEDRLLGAAPPHALRDVFREHVERDPARIAAIRADRPQGPLAVSYVRRGRGQLFPSRYDYILASPHFRVSHAEYDYDRADTAGSDHAVVHASLVLDAA